ncbi:MAG: DNA repair protein RecN, partial [Candidatus Poribacteria bacterium]
MIEELHIQNVALIDDLQLEFSPGLNVLTGETGAGKSVILQSLGLALGERGGIGIVKSGERLAKVQIAVSSSPDHPMWARLNDADVTEDLDTMEALLLSRQISAGGRSRCHINDQRVNLTLLHDIGNLLVDIHGQHEHQSLFRSETHLNLLDAFGELEELRSKLNKAYHEIHALNQELAQLSQRLHEAEREKELFEFQIEELEEAELEEGEEETLTRERRILSNAETLLESASLVYDALYGGSQTNFSVLDMLKKTSTTTTKLCEMDESLTELNSRLESVLYELEDIAYQIRDYRNSVDFNPHRLAEIEERLDFIYRLKRKYGNSIPGILAYQKEITQKLTELQVSSERIEELKDQIRVATIQGQELAIELSEKRKATATRLESLIEKELHTLGMNKAVFRVLV